MFRFQTAVYSGYVQISSSGVQWICSDFKQRFVVQWICSDFKQGLAVQWICSDFKQGLVVEWIFSDFKQQFVVQRKCSESCQCFCCTVDMFTFGWPPS